MAVLIILSTIALRQPAEPLSQIVRNKSLQIESVKNKSSSLHIIFLKIIDQIEGLVKLKNFQSLLMKKCKNLMASKVHGIRFFSDTSIKTLSKYNGILLFRYLSFLFTWNNHSILKNLIEFSIEAVQLLAEFDSTRDRFSNSIITSYPIPNFSLDMIPIKMSDYTILAIRCNKELWQCTLQYVFDIESWIVTKCEITPYCLQLLAVKNDPTIFYWTIPKCIVEITKNTLLQYSKDLYSQGILEVLMYPKQLLAVGDDIMIGSLAFRTKEEPEVILQVVLCASIQMCIIWLTKLTN